MKTAIALALGLAVWSWAGAATFSNAELGLTFQHPDNWKVTTKKGDTRIEIPIEGDSAKLLIFPRSFNADIPLWQSVEKDIAVQQKRTVDSQTQEEIMGVPLLLTRVKYQEKGRSMMELSGLVYSATPKKLLFRLIASEANFDKAEQVWRTAMQTMKTIDGKLPKTEEPGRTVTPDEVKRAEEGPTKVTVIGLDKSNKPKYKKGPVTADTKAAGRTIRLRAPAGWIAKTEEDGSISLSNPALSAPLKVQVLSSLDSPDAQKSLSLAAAKSLAAFKTVASREDVPTKVNAAGASVSIVWRKGEDDHGALMSCDAVGVVRDDYWLVSYSGRMPSPGTKDAKLLETLFAMLSVELAQ